MNYRVRVHPELLDLYDNSPEISLDLPGSLRLMLKERFEKLDLSNNENVSVCERYIVDSNGGKDICLRVYQPSNISELLPGVLWIHGGGYISGCAEMDDPLCFRFVEEASCVVVSVDYHLAPENPFPVPLENCYSALKEIYDNSETYSIDNKQIAIAGASGGGGLVAGLSLMARDRGGPPIVFQMPLYPMIDDRCETPSCREFRDRKTWFKEANELAWKLYLGQGAGENVSQYAAAARAQDYSNLPPTYTCVGDLDLFRDETIEYVSRLCQAKVPVEFHLYPGCFHDFDSSVDGIGSRAKAEYVAALARALHQKP